MQERKQLTDQLLQIMQEIEPKVNRQEFCQVHGISESKLSRIFSGKVQPDFELLDYLAMFAGYQIKLSIK